MPRSNIIRFPKKGMARKGQRKDGQRQALNAPEFAPTRSKPIGWAAFAAITAGLCAALFLAIFSTGGPGGIKAAASYTAAAIPSGDQASEDQERARFTICGQFRPSNCVIDGDTFRYDGRKIRIADINTPELGGARCEAERQLGERAKDRLRSLLNGGAFTLETIDRDQDQYGRDLRIVTRGGHSIGDILVGEGLAEEWQGYRREWC